MRQELRQATSAPRVDPAPSGPTLLQRLRSPWTRTKEAKGWRVRAMASKPGPGAGPASSLSAGETTVVSLKQARRRGPSRELQRSGQTGLPLLAQHPAGGVFSTYYVPLSGRWQPAPTAWWRHMPIKRSHAPALMPIFRCQHQAVTRLAPASPRARVHPQPTSRRNSTCHWPPCNVRRSASSSSACSKAAPSAGTASSGEIWGTAPQTHSPSTCRSHSDRRRVSQALQSHLDRLQPRWTNPEPLPRPRGPVKGTTQPRDPTSDRCGGHLPRPRLLWWPLHTPRPWTRPRAVTRPRPTCPVSTLNSKTPRKPATSSAGHQLAS